MKYTTYENLLEYASEEADSFSLVWRNMAFDESAFELVESLEQWLISDFSCHSWPGTELFSEKARVKTYKLNNDTLKILSTVSSVFDWLAPKYPEDLAFYKNKEAVFASVAHEGEAWFTN